ncbi:MAG TPA: hypothetical protein VLW85_24540 [Myxococcales bacterium]|nr:hypothetical protein [Myxococcales bacterium]
MSILDHVAIRVPCPVCSGEYDVPASVVLDGQKAIAPGCPGCSDYECEPRFVATLVDPQALAVLEAAWARFEASVVSHGGSGVALVAVPTTARPNPDDASARIWRRKAIQRWENEGGRAQPA